MYRLVSVFSGILVKSEIKNGKCKILRILQLYRKIPKYHCHKISLKIRTELKMLYLRTSIS